MSDFLSGQKVLLFQASDDELINSASSQGDNLKDELAINSQP